MQKFLTYTVFLSSLLLLLVGCGMDKHADDHKDASDISLEMMDITFETNLHNLKSEEKVLLSSSISKKDKAVENAEVIFEVWAEGQEPHDNIEAKHKGDGTYSTDYTFTQAGNHHIVVHVTTPELHQMIEKEFNVTK